MWSLPVSPEGSFPGSGRHKRHTGQSPPLLLRPVEAQPWETSAWPLPSPPMEAKGWGAGQQLVSAPTQHGSTLLLPTGKLRLRDREQVARSPGAGTRMQALEMAPHLPAPSLSRPSKRAGRGPASRAGESGPGERLLADSQRFPYLVNTVSRLWCFVLSPPPATLLHSRERRFCRRETRNGNRHPAAEVGEGL